MTIYNGFQSFQPQREREKTWLVDDALRQPPFAITYNVSQLLAQQFPSKAIFETDDSFNLEDYAKAGLCMLQPKSVMFNEFLLRWDSEKNISEQSPANVWFEVEWQNYRLEVLQMGWDDKEYFWIIADSAEVARSFFRAVSSWEAEIRSEVLVFEDGSWDKDEKLFKAIKSATFDNLVLPIGLRQTIQHDIDYFFTATAIYDSYNIPWKRGLLLVGPPGNGKTHAVKALLNWSGQPCLYVKSFKHHHITDEANIRQVFKRARDSAPCILVLEDLDSLLTKQNRSFFLNELDGFASNRGILTLATTNYPEKLDPAIVNRPSRFDRKYHFDLPALPERLTYIKQWAVSLRPPLALCDEEALSIAEKTADFSFAYLKELFVMALMGWFNQLQADGNNNIVTSESQLLTRPELGSITLAQVELLREQMVTTAPAASNLN